ncbi:putative homeobox-leucine zipper protein ATHB-51 [Andrographis paniculata]|uniref:putative homeobox-leucine zipper protein ATHB-51 n=1 Tax=Andrographis paniculata TaxID=175694 RepID=UPI0021E929B3|nr:putative homeobox-leucine zipper protein ATHB-51 [Andrographis paniculata]
MECNGNIRVPYFSRAAASSSENFSFLCNYSSSYEHTFSEMKQPPLMEDGGMVPMSTSKNNSSSSVMNMYGQSSNPSKKKCRMSTEQVESLENSFQEEIKLDPHRKIKLANDLGLHPRQISVWFQNRRARWKGKQLERLYHLLKQEYDAVSMEKHNLQQEVMTLRAMVKDHKQGAGGSYTDKEEAVAESASIPASLDGPTGGSNQQIGECSNNYVYNNLDEADDDDFNPMMVNPYTWDAANLP